MDGAGANPGSGGGFDPCECIVRKFLKIFHKKNSFFF